ncbi:alpha/beta hydrolase family protein [Streptomonospora sp. S1-112]|uniref:Alpha/beta hydrolase family protein n=1 Tax=Streptomonospora mangrovi TaxID=2883123 RepID=A0A9X3SD30_9ACTN|nr:alpha/beta hydrolase [Streptomonospora mangrovi]MDA0564343.1 alpha/beta hydrolase family protein [Streptomonospora mangrovi]
MVDPGGEPRPAGVLKRLLGRTRTAPTPAAVARRSDLVPQLPSPAHYAAWWRGLSDAEREHLVREDPAALGALDGLPAEVRDAANRTALREYLERHTDKDVATLSAALADYDQDPMARMFLMRFTPPSRPGAGDGLTAISRNNPDTATRKLVVVPGAGTGLHNIGRNLRRITRLHMEADAKAGTLGAPDHAVMVWQGARAPRFGPEAARLDLAHAARAPLHSFLAGLKAAHQESESTVVLYGLSYGSVVAAQTVARYADVAADTLIVGAGPGLGKGIAGVADLHVADAYCLASDADSITYLSPALHGVNPASAEAGLKRLATDPHGHHDYLEPGVGLDNAVAVFIGATDDLVAAEPRPAGGDPWRVLRHVDGLVRRQEHAAHRRPGAGDRPRPPRRPHARRGGRKGL